MRVAVAVLGFLFSSLFAQAQRTRGELRVEARDPHGAAMAATAELVCEANQFDRTFVLGPDGRYVIQDLAFGISAYAANDRFFAIVRTCPNRVGDSGSCHRNIGHCTGIDQSRSFRCGDPD